MLGGFITQRVQVPNNEVRFGVIRIMVQVLGLYMTVWYWDP